MSRSISALACTILASTGLSAVSVPETPSEPVSSLQVALQARLDDLARIYPRYAMAVGWKSAGEEFTVSAGSKPEEGGPVGSNDTFLYGSGTKPFTAVAVMRLADQGKLSLDDPASKYVDPYLKFHNQTTLEALFGREARDITVGQLIRMQSGIADFDVPGFDEEVLLAGHSEWTPQAFVGAAANQSPSFVCRPGNCTCYSSTNFILAGIVALSATRPGDYDWKSFDIRPLVFPTAATQPSPLAHFFTDETISKYLTVPGNTSGGVGLLAREDPPSWQLISDQNASILGWTCGNLAAPALDVARWMYELLLGDAIVKPETLAAMRDFRPLDTGWAQGYISYGTGLMIQQTSFKQPFPPKIEDWGAYEGHGGDTYGFLSESGVIHQLNASFSAVSNEDGRGNFVKGSIACSVIQIAAEVLRGTKIDLRCDDMASTAPYIAAARAHNGQL